MVGSYRCFESPRVRNLARNQGKPAARHWQEKSERCLSDPLQLSKDRGRNWSCIRADAYMQTLLFKDMIVSIMFE